MNNPEILATSELEMRLKKIDLLQKFSALKSHGVPLSQDYSMDSDLITMQYEYDMHCRLRNKMLILDAIENIKDILTKM